MSLLIEYAPGEFAEKHSPQSRFLGASFVPSLVLPAAKRPGWCPSPYAKALSILDKRPLPEPDSMEVERGKDLEPTTVLQLQRKGYEARQLNHYCVHPDHPLLMASPDFELADGRLGEGKVPCNFEQWVDGPPLHVQLQAQFQMACAETSNHLITALFVDQYSIDLKIWPVERNDRAIRLLVAKATQFLELIDAGKTPDPDDSKSSYAALQDVIEVNETEQITLAGVEHVERLLAWRQARKDRLAAEKMEEACKYWFGARAGTAGIIATDGGTLFRTKIEPKGKAPYFRWGGI